MILQRGTLVYKFTYNNNNFTFIGERHDGIKEPIQFKGKALLEAHKNLNNFDMKTIKKHYKKKTEEDKKIKNESYIDLFIRSKTKWARKKTLKELNIFPIDTRNPLDYPKSQIRTIYKKNPKLIKKLLFGANRVKSLIDNIQISSIRKKLSKRINNYIKELNNPKSSKLLQTQGEILLDYEIVIHVLNNKDKNVIGIFGKNHVNNLKILFK